MEAPMNRCYHHEDISKESKPGTFLKSSDTLDLASLWYAAGRKHHANRKRNLDPRSGRSQTTCTGINFEYNYTSRLLVRGDKVLSRRINSKTAGCVAECRSVARGRQTSLRLINLEYRYRIMPSIRAIQIPSARMDGNLGRAVRAGKTCRQCR